MATTNNVTRMLEAKNIVYTAHKVPEEKLSALEVAEILNMSPDKVYKTIAAEREKKGKPILAIVPATSEVNAKLLAGALREKKVSITTQERAETLTGLKAGGISALALINKGFQVVLDEKALALNEITISGGQRGLQITLDPQDLIKLTNARTAAIS